MLLHSLFRTNLCSICSLRTFENFQRAFIVSSTVNPLTSFNIPKPTTPGFYESIPNQRQFLEQLAKNLHIKSWEDWYHIPNKTFISTGASTLLGKYDNSRIKTLVSLYPEHDWKIWKFFEQSISKVIPKELWFFFPRKQQFIYEDDEKLWSNTTLQREFLENAFKELSLNSWQDWYLVNASDLVKLGGSGLLNIYMKSMAIALTRIYPEHPWKMQEFQEIKDLRKCLIKGGKEIRVKTLEDWYLVTNEQATQVIGRKYINRFGSMFETLKIVFPEHEWLPCVPDGFWQQKENQRSFLDYVSKILGIKSYEDWYKVTNDEILRLGGSRLLFIYEGDLLTMLQRVYPEFAWESQPNRTLTGYTSKSQMHLFSLISDIFSGTEVFMNHFLGPGFRYSNTRKFMEVDIFVPEHKLAFEYQGRHHYEELQIFGSKLSQRQKRDQEKRQTLETAKITLIDIPYTWNGSKEDLLVTIHKQRPDLNLINPGGPIGLQLKRRKREKNSIDEQSQNE